ncbi:MAG: hypothetical protein HY097_06965 [Nitrospinae bacterium]|nr:hypothetical protein [Nitrospinota bacterium]
MIDWSAINALTNIWRLVRDILKDSSLQREQERGETVILQTSSTPTPEIITSSYQAELGTRHKHLREQVLELNPREMADFYGYEKVAELEKYERGDDEFPTSSIRKLVEVFFINPNFLQEGSKAIFKSFSLCGSEDCEKFLDLGFKPYILCRGDDRSWLSCYIVFHKNDEGYHRVIVSDRIGSFKSTHGGKNNILNLIYPMISRGENWSFADIFRVDNQAWQSLEERTFYRKGMYGWTTDAECDDIFQEWYKDCKAKVKKSNLE